MTLPIDSNVLLQGTARRSQQQLELEIENLGAHLNAYTSVSADPVHDIIGIHG